MNQKKHSVEKGGDKKESSVEKLLLKLVRLYTYNTPISKGKYRLFMTALSFCKKPPTGLLIEVKDGREFFANLTTGMQETVFFLGEFEPFLTEIVKQIVKKGDVCLDAGANFGWFTTLFRTLCGKSGEVHSFEPMPSTFKELKQNTKLLEQSENVFINNVALGDRNGEVEINLFENAPTGHASLSDQGRNDAVSFQCEIKTLDSYLKENQIEKVHFVKVDVKGAEMMFLNGSKSLFNKALSPPIFLMEMALHQTKNFDYLPNDLLVFLRKHADYDFYAADEIKYKLRKIEKIDADDIGANVFCFPKNHHRERIEPILKKYLKND